MANEPTNDELWRPLGARLGSLVTNAPDSAEVVSGETLLACAVNPATCGLRSSRRIETPRRQR
jgi:hypothetical protein